MAPGFIASMKGRPTSRRVSAVAATCTLTTSARAARSSGVAIASMSSSAARSGVRLRDHATTGMPKPRARSITASAIDPRPSTPRVAPYRPLAALYSFLFQRPARSSAVWSGTRRSQARISPQASSATAIAFLPGQLAT